MSRPIRRTLAILSIAVLAAAFGALGVVFAASSPPPSEPQPPSNQANSECIACHSIKALEAKLPSGETLSLYVDPSQLPASVHGGKLQCTDCHAGFSKHPTGTVPFQDLRSYRTAQYELCKRCHFAEYTKTLDSVHFSQMSQGDRQAPVCTDCHGAHNVAPPDQPRSLISRTCSTCHKDVYNTYANSVHGSALVQENNPDVPVCTDCHQVHNIQNPMTAAFRVQSVQLCSNCHSDADKMKKYGISTLVTTTYLQTFHGRSVSLSGSTGEKRDIPEPVCTDCHGVHGIQKVDAASSPVIRDNLLKTCQQCHPGASPNFPDSWMGHYAPTLQQAPAVFLIRNFYKLLIPFIIGGLLVHIVLDLWKVITNR